MYDKKIGGFVLGSLLNNTEILSNSQFPLRKKDFKFKTHYILFQVICELAKNGVKEITPKEILIYLEPFKTETNLIKQEIGEDLIGYLGKLKELDNDNAFEYYYNELRKRSLLSEMKAHGQDISEFYNEQGDLEVEAQKLASLSLDSILTTIRERTEKLEQTFDIDKNIEYSLVDEKSKQYFLDIVDGKISNVGRSLQSPYISTLSNGIMKSNFIISSGDTGSGKSRHLIGDLMHLCANKFYNTENDQWEVNLSALDTKGLYIGSEMKSKEEVHPLMASCVAGVSSAYFSSRNVGNLSEEEKNRILQAYDIIQESNIYTVKVPDFDINDLDKIIKYHKRKYNIDYVAFDYIMLSNKLMNEFSASRSGGGRSDEALLELSKCLKDMAVKYDVGILSATQVNSDIQDYKIRDYRLLRGGKAIADKIDCGIITMPITQQEYKLVLDDITAWSQECNNCILPNISEIFVQTVYKSRASEFPKECKVFSIYNLGTMRQRDMFVTDKYFNRMEMKGMI